MALLSDDDVFGAQKSTGLLSDDDVFGTVSSKKSNPLRRMVADPGISALKGAIAVPEAAVGVADMLTGGRAGKAAEELGFRPKEAKNILDTLYSPEQRAANEAVQKAEGFGETLSAVAQNPSVIPHTVVESLPAMGAGGVVARGLPIGSAVVRGALGEGVVGAGMSAEGIRQESESGLITPKQSALAAASGAGTMAFAAAGGKLASKLGIGDVETLLAGGATKAGKKGLVRSTVEGAASEGLLEELPQSLWEQAAQNLALGKPLTEGLGQAGAMGLVTGMAMGAGGGAVGKLTEREDPPPNKTPEKAPQNPLLALPSPTYTGKQVERQRAIDEADANAKSIYEARAEYEAAQRELNAIRLTTNPEPLQQRIDALLGIGKQPLPKGEQQAYQKALVAALNEPVGITHDADGREIPLTIGAYLDAQVEVADKQRMLDAAAATSPAGEAASARLAQVQDEEATVQPDIAPAPAIPVVGPISAAANLAVQSGLTNALTMPPVQAAPQSPAAQATNPLTSLVAGTPAVQPAPITAAEPVTATPPQSKPAAPVAKAPETTPEEPEVKAYAKDFAERMAARMTNQGMPSEAYPHPTREGMFAIRQKTEGAAPSIPAQAPKVHAEPAPAIVKETIDAAAHEAATSPQNDTPQPTEAQKAAGNYKVGRVALHGLDISIENPQGSTRSGTDPDGKAWETTMAHHYGYIRRTEGNDGDHVDTFIGPNPESGKVFVVDQKNVKTGAFDEHKVLMGFDNLLAASAGYARNYDKGWMQKGVIGIKETTVDGLKDWLKTGDMTQPFGKYGQVASNPSAQATAETPKATGQAQALVNVKIGQFKHTKTGVPQYSVAFKDRVDPDVFASAKAIASRYKAKYSAFRGKGAIPGFLFPDEASALQFAKEIDGLAANKAATDQNPIKNETATIGKTTVEEKQHVADNTSSDVSTSQAANAGQDDAPIKNYSADLPRVDTVFAPVASTEQAQPKTEQFANNKVFTADKVAAARARLKSKLGTLNSGIDPELLMDGMTLAGAYIESGIRAFPGYAKAMVDDFGDKIKPYLLSFYEAARAYPGIDKDGMTPASEAATQHQALLTPEVKEAAKEVLGKTPKVARAPKAKNLGEAMKLKQDWGVDNIDGWTESPTGKNQGSDFGLRGGIKDDFLNDARRYLNQVANLLKEQGFTAHLDRKGKPMPAVSVNEGGTAVSGEASLMMLRDNFGVYVQVGVSCLRGQGGTTHPQGVSILVRTTNGGAKDRYATNGINQWLAVDLNAGDLAAWLAGQDFKRQAEPAEQSAQDDAAVEKPAAEYPDKGKAIVAEMNDDERALASYGVFPAGMMQDAETAGFTDTSALAVAVMDAEKQAKQQPAALVESAPKSTTMEVTEARNANALPAATGNDGEGVSTERTPDDVSPAASGRGTGRGSDDARGSGEGSVRNADGRDAGDGRRGNEPATADGPAGERPLHDAATKQNRRGKSGATARLPERGKRGNDYLAPVGALARKGSWRETAKRNVEIIKLVKQLDTEGRLATADEQALIAQYVGFGASEMANGLFPLKNEWKREGRHGKFVTLDEVDETALKPGWKEVYYDLKDAVSDEDLKAIRASTQFAHFTSEKVIRSIWSAVKQFGFDGGKIVEPGMGTGLFMVASPEGLAANSRYVGIERDYVTASIAKHLLQGQSVIRNDFIAQNLPDASFDLAIGNPPFASWEVTADPRYKKNRFKLHDYFFAKTIDKVRPGGLLVFVTSKGTMDKLDDKARAFLAERADLVGAIRLPQTAFKGNAGTEVVTDVIFLKKREAGAAPSGPAWAGMKEVETPQGPTLINEYFADHPEMILGRNELTGSMYRSNEYTVTPLEGDIEEHFAAAVEKLPKAIYSKAKEQKAGATQGIQEKADRQDFDVAGKKEGGLYVADDGELMQVVSGVGTPLSNLMTLNDKERAWLKDYTGLRDALKTAMNDQMHDGEWEKSLAALKKTYAAFKAKHGRIFEHTRYERTFVDDAGEEETRVYKRFKWNKLLGSDVDVEVTLLNGLEVLSETSDKIEDGGLLKGRVLERRGAAEIKTINDAFAVTLNDLGTLNLPRIAEIMKVSEADAIEQLGDLIYEDPAAGWQTADEYLSGNVLKKLEEAEVAAGTDPRFERNVKALIDVQPAPLGPDRIVVRLGANWIGPHVVTAFAAEALGEEASVSYEPRTNTWTVEGETLRKNRRAGAEWGTADRSMPEILSAVLNNQSITVRRTTEDKKTYVDKDATAAANDLAEKMRQRFASWVWTDAARTGELLSIYNRKFNNLAPRRFDGSHMTLPGLSLRYKLYDHQLRAIWRVVQTGNTYLNHAVGAGKTLEMIVSAMEQKRLGLINKPMFVVPNHMLDQFANEFQDAYPAARVLVADKDNFTGDARRRFVAKAALNDWDAIVIKQSSFGLIGIQQDTADSVADDLLYELQSALDDTDKGDRTTRKKLEAQIDGIKQRVSALAGHGDKNISFEEMGVDFLYVDEAHTYRKLDFATNRQVKGIDPSGSKGAFGLFAKMRHLEAKRPGRSAVLASGTPVTNTIAELYTIQRYLDYAGLDDDGLVSFDAWANNYGAVGFEWERNAAGEYEKVERFSKFVNIPELMMRVRKFMDVLTMEQLGDFVTRPELNGGGPEMVTAEKSDALDAYMHNVLLPRLQASKQWKPTKDEPYNPDPVIAIGTDGRLAAIDARFANPSLKDDPGSKLNLMINGIIAEYQATANNVYTTNGKNDATKGGAQIIFSSVGFGDNVEQNRGFSPRKWMLKRLKDAGIPASEVAFMGDYKTDKQKEAMFKDMREGRKRILVGSPANMGTGVNVQKRLTALHFMAPPWYPADVEQPHGRILRQGNQNKKVSIKWYVTAGTYDSTMWGMVRRKGQAIEQAFRGDGARTIEDISEVSSYAMAEAVAAGDDRVIKLAEAQANVEKYQRLKNAHFTEQQQLRSSVAGNESRVRSARKRILDLEEAKRLQDAANFRYWEDLPVTVGGETTVKFLETGKLILARIAEVFAKGRDGEQPVGKVLGTFDLIASMTPAHKSKKVSVELLLRVGPANMEISNGTQETWEQQDEVGLAQRVRNAMGRVSEDLRRVRDTLEETEAELKKQRSRVGAPFEDESLLAQAIADAATLQAELVGESVKKQNERAAAKKGADAAPEAVADEGAGNIAGKDKLTPADKAIYGMAAEGKTTAEILQFIASGSRSLFNRQVAKLLLKTGIAPNITVGDSKGWKFNAGEGHKYAAGYNPKTDTVALFRPAASERNVLHELVHAATLNALAKRGMAAVQMKKLFEHVQKSGKLRGLYGMANVEEFVVEEFVVEEFVAEAFTNPKFQQALKKVKANNSSTLKSAWHWFVRVVRGILGMNQGQENALSAALEIGVELMRENMSLSGDGVENGRYSGSRPQIASGHALPFRQSDNHPIDGERLRELRRIAAGLERTEDGIFLRVEGDGRAISTGPKGARIPASFRRFAHDNGLAFYAERRLPQYAPGRPASSIGGTFSGNSAPMPIEYREGGARYFGEDVGVPIDRTDQIRYTLTEQASQQLYDLLHSDAKFNVLHKTVATQYHKASVDKHFKKVFDLGQKYLLDVSRFAMDAADVAPKLLPKLGSLRDVFRRGPKRADLEAIAAPVFEGTLENDVFSDDELRRRFHLTGAQIDLYREARAGINKSLDDLGVSEMARLAKPHVDTGIIEQAKTAESLDASRDLLQGELLAAVDTLVGEARQARTAGNDAKAAQLEDKAAVVERVIDDVMKKAGRIHQLKAQGYAPLMRFGRFSVDVVAANKETGEQERKYFGMYETQRDANRAARALAEEFPGATVEQGIMDSESWKLFGGIDPSSLEVFAESIGADESGVFQEYLRLTKNNRDAMKRLIQRKGVAGFSKDTQRVLAGFVTSNGRLAAKNYHFGDMKQAVMDIPKHKGDVKSEAAKLVDYLQNPQEEAVPLRGYLFVHFMGGSVASALTNMTQPITMTAPYLAQFGGAIKAGAALRKAMRQYATRKFDPQLQQALKLAEKEGITEPHEIHQLFAETNRGGLARNMLVRKGLRVWGSFFSLAESFNREITFVAAYNMARDAGKADPFAFAQKAVEDTQGIYNKGNRPNWARGAVGATVFTFKQFSIGYVEFLVRLAKSDKKAFALAMAIMFLGAGAEGWPFAEDVEDIIDTVGQILGYATNSKAWVRKMAADILGETGGEIFRKGISGLPNSPIDLSKRIGVQNLIPGTAMFKVSETDKSRDVMEFVGPMGGFLQSAMEGAEALRRGDAAGLMKKAAPLSVQNAFKAMDMATDGYYSDTRGRKVIETDGVDAAMKLFGFQPNAVARESAKINEIHQNVTLARKIEGEIADKWAEGIHEKDQSKVKAAMADLMEWNRRNPEARIAIQPSQIAARLKTMMMSREQRFLKTVPKEMRTMAATELRS